MTDDSTRVQATLAQAKVHREIVMNVFQQHLANVWTICDSLPDEQRQVAQNAIQQVWDAASANVDLVLRAEANMENAQILIAAAVEVAREYQSQRDAIADEMAKLTQHIAQVSQSIWEDAHITILESLPNDIAAALGITPGDAAILYNLLNDPDEEELAFKHDLDPALVAKFRAAMISLLGTVLDTRGGDHA